MKRSLSVLLSLFVASRGEITKEVFSSELECKTVDELRLSRQSSMKEVAVVRTHCDGTRLLEEYHCVETGCIPKSEDVMDVGKLTSFDSVPGIAGFTTAYGTGGDLKLRIRNSWVDISSQNVSGVTIAEKDTRTYLTVWNEGDPSQLTYQLTTVLMPSNQISKVYSFTIPDEMRLQFPKAVYISTHDVFLITAYGDTSELHGFLVDASTGQVTKELFKISDTLNRVNIMEYDVTLLSDGLTVGISSVSVSRSSVTDWRITISAIRVVGSNLIDFRFNDARVNIPPREDIFWVSVKSTKLDENRFLVVYHAGKSFAFSKVFIPTSTSPVGQVIEVANVMGDLYYPVAGEKLVFDVSGTGRGMYLVYSDSTEAFVTIVRDVSAFNFPTITSVPTAIPTSSPVSVTKSPMKDTDIPETVSPAGLRISLKEDTETWVIIVIVVGAVAVVFGIAVIVWFCYCSARNKNIDNDEEEKDTNSTAVDMNCLEPNITPFTGVPVGGIQTLPEYKL